MKKTLFALLLSASALQGQAADFLICRLFDPATAPAIATSYGIELVDATPNAPFVLFELPPGADIHFYQTLLTGDSRVVWAEDDAMLETPENQSGKGSVANVIADRSLLYSENVGLLQQIRWVAPSPKGVRAARLAILDTGLSPQVPRLWNRVVATANTIERKGDPFDLPYGTDTNANRDPDEGAGHGTMIAGIVDFLAPSVDLIIVRVADSDGFATSWSIIKGLAFAVAEGAEVANISLGSEQQLNAVGDVLDWTEEKGLLVVAAAGNSNLDKAQYPSAYSNTICVTGVDPSDRKAPFSNWGSDADLAAPATGIKSTFWNGNTGTWSGTSFAAPIVSALIADALRNGRRYPAPMLQQIAEGLGDNIDDLNPQYSGEIGLRINGRTVQRKLAIYLSRRW